MTVSVIAAAAALIGLGGLLWSSHLRGYRRRFYRRVGVLFTVAGFAALAVALPDELGLPFADALGVVGLALGVVFGLWGGTIVSHQRRICVAIVIPSKAPFHREVRRGIAEALLDQQDIVVLDEYLIRDGPQEDLSAFLPCLRSACRRDPDYLVLCAAVYDEPTSHVVAEVTEDLAKRGGGVIIIENGSIAGLSRRARARTALIESDSEAGARVLAEFLATTGLHDGGNIVVLAGPQQSRPAQIRSQFIREQLPNSRVEVADTSGWSEQGAYGAATRALSAACRPSLFVCGNDTMALGAVAATRDSGLEASVRVVGYDGVPRALSAIAEPTNPFLATVRIPPSAYGHEIISIISDDLQLGRVHLRSMGDRVIPITSSNLVTDYNVENVLDG